MLLFNYLKTKIMKKIRLYCLSLLLLNSCGNEFLITAPEDKSTDGTFYITENHFRQAVTAIYNPLRDHSYASSCWLMGEMRSDNTHYNHYSANRLLTWEDVTNFINTSQNEHTNNYWRVSYIAIARANTVIDRIEDKNFPDMFKEEILGEARFLRAYLYFELVKNFGGIPLNLHEVKSPEEAFLPRNTVDEVYSQIIEDVKYAIDKLPAVTNFPADGRATGGAAKMLYAYVMMTKPQRDYPEAEKQLKDLLNMDYDLLDDYKDVYDTSRKNSKEHIFSIQYMMGDYGMESIFLYEFLPRTSDTELATGVKSANNINTGGWNIPTQQMIDSYEPGDKRLHPSIAVAVGSSTNGEVLVYEDILEVGDPKIEQHAYAKPFINKYRWPHTKVNNTDDNWPVYRYADALLLLAENLVEQGRTSEAAQYVNKVRNRAGLSDISTVTAEVVANERKHELAFENHRWHDLLRTGKAIEVMTEYAAYIKSVDRMIPANGYNISQEKLLYPIPYREIVTNPDITQNPGY
jgi:hypothetical protein